MKGQHLATDAKPEWILWDISRRQLHSLSSFNQIVQSLIDSGLV